MRPDGRKLTLSGIGYAPYTHAQAWAIVLICCEVLLEPGCDEWQWFHAFFCFGPFRNDCFKKVFVCRKRGRYVLETVSDMVRKTVPGPDAGRRSIFIEEARRGFGRA